MGSISWQLQVMDLVRCARRENKIILASQNNLSYICVKSSHLLMCWMGHCWITPFVLKLSSVVRDCQLNCDVFLSGPSSFISNVCKHAHTGWRQVGRINLSEKCVFWEETPTRELSWPLRFYVLLDGLFVTVRNYKILGSRKV